MHAIRNTLLCALVVSIAVSAASAAQLATAKVLEVKGTVSVYSGEQPPRPLKQGDILEEGDAISTSHLSSAKLAFSNGSLLTVEENTSMNLEDLQQQPFSGNRSYEQLKADPSKSQTQLHLNYGRVSGKVKRLRNDSKFHIKTPIGTAAVRGTAFFVELRYNVERREMILFVSNEDGLVDIISRYAGEIQYGTGNIGDKGYDSSISDEKEEPIPPEHKVVIRLQRGDPYFDDLIDFIQNIPPFQSGEGSPEVDPGPDGPEFVPEDPGVVVASPEGPEDDD